MKMTRQQSVRIFVASLNFQCYFENFSHESQKTLGHANTGLSKLTLENEHEAGLLNFVTGINLFALQLMIPFVHFLLEKGRVFFHLTMEIMNTKYYKNNFQNYDNTE